MMQIRQNLDPIQDDAYEALDQLIGLCATKRTDASLNHDAIIYLDIKF